MSKSIPTTPHVIFYFDVVCPFAYIASERIDDIARFTGSIVEWRPVLLGGLYDLTNAPQGKANSALDVPMPIAKRKLLSEDFNREVARYQLPLNFHPNHPLKSVDAGRLLAAFPSELRPLLAHKLFQAYWKDNLSIDSRATLLRIARSLKLTSIANPNFAGPFSLTPQLPFLLDESIFADVQHADTLRSNTQEAFDRGAFGVPTFFVEETSAMFFGQDRMHLLEAEMMSVKLGKPISEIKQIERLHPRCLRSPPEDRARTLKFWFDFSSPWSYLGWTQLERLQRDSGSGLKIILKPFLLGALFKEIGTPMLPGMAMIESKRKYAQKDLEDWNQYWNAVNTQEYPPIESPDFKYCSEFPIRSVTALRVALLEPKTVACIYRACWSEDKRVSDPQVLAEVLTAAGFDGPKLVAAATTGPKAAGLKEALKNNTDEAVRLGICGAPTYQIDSTLVWGGDRTNVVADLIAGWSQKHNKLLATVAGYPFMDYTM